MKPTWQRAKIFPKDTEAFPAAELWVRVEHPRVRWGIPSYVTHLRFNPHRTCYVNAERVELLARGPEDFRRTRPALELVDAWVARHRAGEVLQ